MELERGPFKNPKVIAATARFVALKLDATADDDPAVAALRKKYRVVGLPTLVLLDASGREVKRFDEFVPADQLAAALQAVE
jgi:thiol:disulfide interchange protein DsbD